MAQPTAPPLYPQPPVQPGGHVLPPRYEGVPTIKLLVCGDRNYTNKPRIYNTLGAFGPDTIVIHGDCRGADRLAGEIAEQLGMEVHVYPAEWDRLGRAAGVIRNGVMLTTEQPDMVIAFHDHIESSKGTKDMLTKGHAAGVRCYIRDSTGLWRWPKELGKATI